MRPFIRPLRLCLLVCCTLLLMAAKPAPPPPPAPGTIYFRYQGDLMRMNGDGSGAGVVFAGAADVIGEISHTRHNGRRWFLMGLPDLEDGEGDVYATPDNVTFIQLTDAEVRDNGDGTETIFRIKHAYWSNDGLDSYIVVGYVYGSRIKATGEVLGDYHQAIAELAIGAAELELIYANEELPDPKVFGPDPLLTPLVTTTSGRPHFRSSHISPDGTGRTTIAPHGGVAYWSPDGQFLARDRTTTKGSKTTRVIERVPAAGGSPVVLFTGDPELGKSVAGWTD